MYFGINVGGGKSSHSVYLVLEEIGRTKVSKVCSYVFDLTIELLCRWAS